MPNEGQFVTHLPEYPVDPEAAKQFPLRIPAAFFQLIDPENPADPLLRQVLPVAEELLDHPGFTTDPLAEAGPGLLPGLLRKYPGRALLLVSNACPIHCRYCFRRHRPQPAIPRSEAAWQPFLHELNRDASLHEVILSGGEPLMWPDEDLHRLTQRLAAIPHLRRLRLHTRMVTAIPERIGPACLAWLTGSRLRPVVVVHVNHPAELGASARRALAGLIDAGIPVLQQGVLLRGVNDSLPVLQALYEALIDLRVMPYYLHLLDPVAGAGHFQVEEGSAVFLMAELRARLPGYAVPRLAREIPGESGKRILA